MILGKILADAKAGSPAAIERVEKVRRMIDANAVLFSGIYPADGERNGHEREDFRDHVAVCGCVQG